MKPQEEVVKRKGSQLHEIVKVLNLEDCETFIDSTLNDYTHTLKELPTDEMWDKYSERIDTDIDSLQFFAGRDVMTREQFKKCIEDFVLAVTPNEVQK